MSGVMRALVVDDHPLVAQATGQLLSQIERMEVVGTAHSGEACLALIPELQPDMVFLDYQLPDQYGTSVAKQIKEQYPHIHIVIFTGMEISDLFDNLVDLKVSGILSKESSETTIKNMIRAILDDHTVLPISLFQQLRLSSGQSAPMEALTKDEIEIMLFIVQGLTHEQVAVQIHMSKRSVDNYIKKIYQKLGVKSRAQAIEKFVQGDDYRLSGGRE